MKTKCIIVDDEPLAIKVIKNHLQSFKDIEIVAECSNAIETDKILREKNVDLIFLDIEMPKVSGFDFLKSLKQQPKVIIITAYRDYALKGYEYDIVDYLLKPVSFDRFYKAINKYYKQQKGLEIQIFDEGGKTGKQFVYFNEDKTIHKIFLDEILYLESFREYIKVHTLEKSVMTKLPISKIEEKLKDHEFIRIHKSFVVSVAKVKSFNSRIININNTELPIGRTYKDMVMKTLKYDPELL
ncbi:MAG: LytTR family DNA-binding domain-containing protein [Bacteroidales bacterium]|nr:LytTR family DNA-binding domain-containing protein [Bacteroidales bacterium]